MKAFDVDVQILGFAVPLILPEDFTLSIGHTYVRPIAFARTMLLITLTHQALTSPKIFHFQMVTLLP